ncbi:hypothetical protein GF339_01825, partial [candidate division KSB3 bacterium]|nr:hypothetical protein [candidate division KSB3 bacterium]MBD3323290.1 hypothetical protein [candidate division KSB3 bacterium]
MNTLRVWRISLISLFMLLGAASLGFALGETGQTVTYKVLHDTTAGTLTTYTHYSIVAQEPQGYWLQ